MGLKSNAVAWFERWDARMKEIEPTLVELNEMLPKEHWVLTTVQDDVKSHQFNPVIVEWAEEFDVPMSFSEIEVIDGHTLTTIKFEGYDHLVLFKLMFEGRDIPEM